MGSIPAWRATDGPKFERISDLPFSSSLFKTHRQLYCPSFVVLPKASGLLKILQNLVHLAEADLRTNSLLSRSLFPLRLRNPVSLLVQSREPRHQELQKVRVFSLHFLRNNSRRRIWSVSRCSKSQELCRSGRNPSASYHSFYLLRSIFSASL